MTPPVRGLRHRRTGRAARPDAASTAHLALPALRSRGARLLPAGRLLAPRPGPGTTETLATSLCTCGEPRRDRQVLRVYMRSPGFDAVDSDRYPLLKIHGCMIDPEFFVV